MATAVKCDQCGTMKDIEDANGWIELAVRSPGHSLVQVSPDLKDLCSVECVGNFLEEYPGVQLNR